MKELVLVRHGATECTMKGLLCGRHDPELIPESFDAARRTATHQAVARAQLKVTSPARRASATASCLLRESEILQVDDRLLEIDFGTWDGLHRAEAARRSDYQAWLVDPAAHTPPGGEAIRTARDRLVEAAEEHLRSARRVVMVSHKGAIRLILSHYLRLPLRRFRSFDPMPTCSVSVLRFQEETAELIRLGDVSHLGGKRALGAY